MLQLVPEKRRDYLAGFIVALIRLFRDLNFVYMEVNPLVMTDDGRITPLDMAAKIDETAHFLACIEKGEPCRSSFEDGHKVVKALEAACQSMRDGGREISIDYALAKV